MLKAYINCKIYTGEEVLTNKSVIVDSEKIVDISNAIPENVQIIDLKGNSIAPGLIDIQLNGGYYRYFSETPNMETLAEMEKASCDYATPYFLATLISSPEKVIFEAIEAIKSYKTANPNFLGMHLEGPFLNAQKRGAHHPAIVRLPTDRELKNIIEKGSHVIKVITIAPEIFTDYQLDMLLDSDIIISAGHSTMTYEQAQYYFGKGINLVTHLFNAMTQFGHREPGMVGAVFENENVHAPVIVDGGHINYATLRIARRLKGEKLFLISDSSFLGRKKTRFDWEGFNISMEGGFYRDRFDNLAGAAISMPEAIRNTFHHLGATQQEAIEMATSRAARAIGIENKIGFIKKGYPSASLILFDDDFEEVRLLKHDFS
jgi:N-acetylglucosamine-6-phosphate deacetylase